MDEASFSAWGPVMLLEVLRYWLERFRRSGVPFDVAWRESKPRALKSAAAELEEWRAVLEETRGAWEAAYDGIPIREPLSLLREGRCVPVSEVERACAHCGGGMEGRPKLAVYCSVRCRRDAAYRRESLNVTRQIRKPSDRSSEGLAA